MSTPPDLQQLRALLPDLGPYGFGDTPEHWPPDFSAQVATAQQYLARVRLAKQRGSYALKHEAESSGGMYVSNGALIFAAILSGFDVQRCAKGPNAIIKGEPS